MGSRVGISLYLYNLNFIEMPSGDTVRFEVCAAQSQQGRKRESCQEISVEIFPQIKPCSSCRNQSNLRETIQIHKKVSLVLSSVDIIYIVTWCLVICHYILLSQVCETNLNFVFLRQSPPSLLGHLGAALPSLTVSCLIEGGGEEQRSLLDNPSF